MSEQPSSHPQPKLSPVRGAVGSVHQESDSSATTSVQELTLSPPESSYARDQPSNVKLSAHFTCCDRCSVITRHVKTALGGTSRPLHSE